MFLDGIPITGLTAPTVVTVIVLMVLTGRIVPRATYKDKAVECDRWREAYEKEREARSQADAQSTELLELAKTTNAFITAVFTNSERIRQSGDADANLET